MNTMYNELETKVIRQNVAGVSMEDYMADMIERMERKELENIDAETRIKAYKQLNVRHKNIIDAQRVINKSLELELMRLSAKASH